MSNRTLKKDCLLPHGPEGEPSHPPASTPLGTGPEIGAGDKAPSTFERLKQVPQDGMAWMDIREIAADSKKLNLAA